MTLLLATASGPVPAADLIDFWSSPRHGGNSFNRLPPDQAYFDALSGYGASWVRLSYDKWKPAQRDFLLGNADRYEQLSAADLEQLRETLDRAHRAGLKVVIAPLSLPGMRWSQNNQGQFDDRLWQGNGYALQAARFWRDLARELKDHPAIAAYNLVNEPAPEKRGGLAEHASAERMQQWYARVQGGARDLPRLYGQLIAAIREVDTKTPVMVDAGWFASADAFGYWRAPLADERVLYSVHMYEPYAATSAPNLLRKDPIHYPGPAPFGGEIQQWDAERVRQYLNLPLVWMERMKLPFSRLVVGEFGCMRRLPGCSEYLEDVLSVTDRHRLHWAFYSFREDSWDGMDYELGSAKVPWQYWQAIEQDAPDPLARKATAEFEPIRRRLAD
ncbi:glycoside hydrolase family 5 protein [Pseudomonas sp. NPDC089996]|uniref:glycoside hydrolase family 5 protein n=1 Tax=Pseudomonas sp. NPDC089996 TaxID=3364474 RepID=UPI003801BEAF